jgi:hypothetical protein
VRGGSKSVTVKLTVREYCTGARQGEPIGATVRAFLGTRLIKVFQPQLTLGSDCSITAKVPFSVAKKQTYRISFELNDKDGVLMTRNATVVGV